MNARGGETFARKAQRAGGGAATLELMDEPAAAPTNETARYVCDRWTVGVYDCVASTNAVAATLPAWTAVRADRQTAGRGRTGRHWVSDTGGLWLSAVLPCPGARAKWAILPLAAGWALIGALREFGVDGARLRWPNDVMVGRRKLAGLLVERHRDDTAVVGVGLNVFNAPEEAEAGLEGLTARLGDLVPGGYDLAAVTRLVLRALDRVHRELHTDGFRHMAEAMNAAWEKPGRVEITLAGREQSFRGWFAGIDQNGRLRIVTERDGAALYEAAQVTLLRELD